MSTFQKITIALLSTFIVCILSVVGYHFLVTIPHEKAEKIELDRRELQLKEDKDAFDRQKALQEQQAKVDAESRVVQAEQSKKADLESCLKRAKDSYDSQRAAGCTKQYNEEYGRYEICLGEGDNDETNPYCKTLIETSKGDKQCRLYYDDMGVILSDRLEKAKAECRMDN